MDVIEEMWGCHGGGIVDLMSLRRGCHGGYVTEWMSPRGCHGVNATDGDATEEILPWSCLVRGILDGSHRVDAMERM